MMTVFLNPVELLKLNGRKLSDRQYACGVLYTSRIFCYALFRDKREITVNNQDIGISTGQAIAYFSDKQNIVFSSVHICFNGSSYIGNVCWNCHWWFGVYMGCGNNHKKGLLLNSQLVEGCVRYYHKKILLFNNQLVNICYAI
eukprot:TRINITY_DN3247_c0_g1_i2.p7 TRINITY_DN3247_c0_g1~~TRINITY_DN3247_c0_g1_i2.p7  ORF type:complete len:143 (+),score=2.06 TRINITY_DN3247_c0_g1_i2:1020-1448(+)